MSFYVITSDKEDMFSLLFICLSVINFAKKTSKQMCMKFSGKVGNGPMNKLLNFGGNQNHCLDTGIVFLALSLLEDTESG